MNLRTILRSARQWFSEAPERALDRAYKAALSIKEIEDNHFRGQKVSLENSDYGDNVTSYFAAEVEGYLQTIKMKLYEFKSSRSFLNISGLQDYWSESEKKNNPDATDSASLIILEKLRFIDEITNKYRDGVLPRQTSESDRNLSVPEVRNLNTQPPITPKDKITPSTNKNSSQLTNANKSSNSLEAVSSKTGVLPRSFLRTINRIKQEIDPKSGQTEEEVLKKFRRSRYKTAISIKFILLLIIIPLLTHQLTKTFVLNPLVNAYFGNHDRIVFINKDFEEEAFIELQHFEESLRFKSLIGLAPSLSPEEMEREIKDKAVEMTAEYRHRGSDAIANVFADIFSLGAFAVVIAVSRREIETVKNFLDEILYSLSDSAKAFLIILFTDMFVGFHSPHGWEVILEGIARHFGLPENREFNFLFIATFPVILDTVLKYWIFRYLNRISPSAVATYRNMNE